MTKRKIHIIDAAEGKTLGRIATQAAILLRGKHKPTFVLYKDEGDFVKIINASKLRVTGKKADQKVYWRHSGYMGGLTGVKLGRLLKDNPASVLKKAIYGMLPTNKLRDKMITRLIVEA